MARKDHVELAGLKALAATNLFAQAKDQLDKANALLEAGVAADEVVVAALQNRIVEAKSQNDRNAKVAQKLSEFVA